MTWWVWIGLVSMWQQKRSGTASVEHASTMKFAHIVFQKLCINYTNWKALSTKWELNLCFSPYHFIGQKHICTFICWHHLEPLHIVHGCSLLSAPLPISLPLSLPRLSICLSNSVTWCRWIQSGCMGVCGCVCNLHVMCLANFFLFSFVVVVIGFVGCIFVAFGGEWDVSEYQATGTTASLSLSLRNVLFQGHERPFSFVFSGYSVCMRREQRSGWMTLGHTDAIRAFAILLLCILYSARMCQYASCNEITYLRFYSHHVTQSHTHTQCNCCVTPPSLVDACHHCRMSGSNDTTSESERQRGREEEENTCGKNKQISATDERTVDNSSEYARRSPDDAPTTQRIHVI